MDTLLEAAWYALMGVGLLFLLAVLAVLDALFDRDDGPHDDERSD